jgi:hypothetical protein
MDLSFPNHAFLDMTSQEAHVFKALQQIKRENVSVIARRAHLPRTTAGFLLRKLRDRGLVESLRVRNHQEWQLCSQVEIADRLKSVMQSLLSVSPMGIVAIEGLTIEVFRSDQNMETLASRILMFGKRDRVYYIQSLDSAKYQMKKMNKEFLKQYHYAIKEKKLIMETIASQRILNLFEDLSFSELAGHHGRFIVAYFVPDQFVDFPADILIYRDTVIIVDYAQEMMVSIKNTLIASIFLNLFELIKLHAKRVDLNAHILHLMEKRRTENKKEPRSA